MQGFLWKSNAVVAFGEEDPQSSRVAPTTLALKKQTHRSQFAWLFKIRPIFRRLRARGFKKLHKIVQDSPKSPRGGLAKRAA